MCENGLAKALTTLDFGEVCVSACNFRLDADHPEKGVLIPCRNTYPGSNPGEQRYGRAANFCWGLDSNYAARRGRRGLVIILQQKATDNNSRPRAPIARCRVVKAITFRKLSGEEVRFLRKEVGMKAKAFAQRIEMSPENLSRVENGSEPLDSRF